MYLVSPNGPQFIAKDFKEFIRIAVKMKGGLNASLLTKNMWSRNGRSQKAG